VKILGFNRVELIVREDEIHDAIAQFNELLGLNLPQPHAIEGHPVLFSGDTLFPGGPGNTKFENASFDQIITSIDRRLFTLDSDILVLPGHGLDTTIGTERPHLQEWIDRRW